MESNLVSIVDITINNDSYAEETLDRTFLKTAPYQSKQKSKTTKTVLYKNVMIKHAFDKAKSDDLTLIDDFAKKHIAYYTTLQPDTVKGIYDAITEGIKDGNFKIDVISENISLDDIGITYCDGSSNGKTGSLAAYATIQALDKVAIDTDQTLLEDYSGTYRKFKVFAGKIQSGTNNIGELNGVKTAIDEFNDKNIQLIVSDSEYSIKCFREWIFTWKANDYRGSNGKQIMNLELIKSIDQAILDSKKIVVFKWTKGHADDSFNERCDLEAKSQIGIKK
jgi:ribonuclease HI